MGTRNKTTETVEILREFADSRGIRPRIDRERGVLAGVKILGLESANGRRYPKETVARAMALYEGAKVNVNHPAGHPGSSRNYEDRIGVLRSVRLAEADQGLFGDLHFNPKHALAEQLLWDAEHAPENVGFSHNVEAVTNRGRDGKIVVEEIRRVQSVDLVADPATTKGLFEAQGTEPRKERTMLELTLESLRADRPELVAAIGDTAVKTYLESEEGKKQAAEVKALREENERMKADQAKAAKKSQVDAAIVEAKLPAALVTEVFRGQCYAAADDTALKALIEDRRLLAPTAPVQSREQQLVDGQAAPKMEPKAFVESITG